MSAQDEWRWTDENGVQRLVSTDELRGALASGVLPSSTLVWREGMAAWAAAASMPEFAIAAPHVDHVPEKEAGEDDPTEEFRAADMPDRAPGGTAVAAKAVRTVSREMAGATPVASRLAQYQGAAKAAEVQLAAATVGVRAPELKGLYKRQATLTGIDAPAGVRPAVSSQPIIVPTAGGMPEPGVARAITQVPRFGTPEAQAAGGAMGIPRAPKVPFMAAEPRAEGGAAQHAHDASVAPKADVRPGASASGGEDEPRAAREKQARAEKGTGEGTSLPTAGRAATGAPAKKSTPLPPRPAAGRNAAPRPSPATSARRSSGPPGPPATAAAALGTPPQAAAAPAPVHATPASGATPAPGQAAPRPARFLPRAVPPPPVPVRPPSTPPKGMETPLGPRTAPIAADRTATPWTLASALEPVAPAAAPARDTEPPEEPTPPALPSTPPDGPPSDDGAETLVLAMSRASASTAATPPQDQGPPAPDSGETDTVVIVAGADRPVQHPAISAFSAVPAAAEATSSDLGTPRAPSQPPVPRASSQPPVPHASSQPPVPPTPEVHWSSGAPPESLDQDAGPRLLKGPVQVPFSSLIVAGGALIFMAVTAFFVGRCSVAGGSRDGADGAEGTRSGIGSALAVAKTSMPALPRPCWVARQPRRWAPLVAKNIPFDVAMTSAGTLAVGYARDSTEAAGIEIDPGTGAVTEKFSRKELAPIARVFPASRGEDGFVVALEGQEGLRSPAQVPGPAPFMIGLAAGAVAAADRMDAPPTPIWSVSGGEELEALRVTPADARGYALTFRREKDVWSGWIGHDRKPLGELRKMIGSGGTVGKPSSGWNGREIAVIFADRPTEDDRWQIRIGHAEPGQTPASTEVIPLPEGGPGRDAFAPDIAGLPDGRWVLIWTEGPPGSRAMRAQTLGPDFRPVGDPIALSPPAGNFGQGILGVAASYIGAVFLSKPGDSYELWGAILQCG